MPSIDSISVRTSEHGDKTLDDCIGARGIHNHQKNKGDHMTGERTPSVNPEDFKKEILAKYPPKVARKRAKHFVVNKKVDETGYVPEIQANVRTMPGIITQRGCSYAGCKGVVMGPTRDIVNLTHGPIGCGFYSWLTRRNQTDPSTDAGRETT
jgi:nitrogenase molybdenum-iron protein alpha chain